MDLPSNPRQHFSSALHALVPRAGTEFSSHGEVTGPGSSKSSAWSSMPYGRHPISHSKSLPSLSDPRKGPSFTTAPRFGRDLPTAHRSSLSRASSQTREPGSPGKSKTGAGGWWLNVGRFNTRSDHLSVRPTALQNLKAHVQVGWSRSANGHPDGLQSPRFCPSFNCSLCQRLQEDIEIKPDRWRHSMRARLRGSRCARSSSPPRCAKK